MKPSRVIATILGCSRINQQSALNLYIFHHFPKNLDRTITFYSVTLKNTQTEPQKNIKKYYFFLRNKKYLESADIVFYFFPTFEKTTVGGFVNQIIKKFWPNAILQLPYYSFIFKSQKSKKI